MGMKHVREYVYPLFPFRGELSRQLLWLLLALTFVNVLLTF